MTDKQEFVDEVLKWEKLKVLIYPVVIPTFLYGLWITMFPSILETYQVYSLINSVVQSWEIGSLFMASGVLAFVFFYTKAKRLLMLVGIIILMLWSMFAVSFLSTPPPNTVWLFAATMSYISYSFVRRV